MATGKSIFDIIKKQNGEGFAKAVRSYDNGIFDVANLVEILRYAGRKAEPIMDYLVSLKDIQIEEHGVYQHPIELLKNAGYDAYYADTLKKQNAIEKHYAPGEELCTFRDTSRFLNYHIINAVKENVEKIKRSDFNNPEREDTYGTSVISIQILKSGGFISIKNRYNHAINNPDNTFNSNPDNIIKGLSQSIKHYYKVDFSSQKVQLPNNFTVMNNHLINYNHEINNTYFGADFYAQNGVVNELDKNSQIMLDYFVLDMKDRTIEDPSHSNDSFLVALQEEIKGKNLQIKVNEDGNKCLLADGVQLLELENGEIVSLNLPNTTRIGDGFLKNNKSLRNFTAPNLQTVGDDFLYYNKSLRNFTAPNLQTVGDRFLYFNEILEEFTVPNLQTVGGGVLYCNKVLKEFTAPNLETVGDYFLHDNEVLEEFTAPNLQTVGSEFLRNNEILEEFTAPNLETVGNAFLHDNKSLRNFTAPNLETVGNAFLRNNKILEEFTAPNLETVGKAFLHGNEVLEEFTAPNLETVGNEFLYYNEILEEFTAPNLETVGDYFLCCNKALEEFTAPKLRTIGNEFLYYNKSLRNFTAPKLETVGNCYLYYNEALKEFTAPKLETIGNDFLYYNKSLRNFTAPNLQKVGNSCLVFHPNRESFLSTQKKGLRATLSSSTNQKPSQQSSNSKPLTKEHQRSLSARLFSIFKSR